MGDVRLSESVGRVELLGVGGEVKKTYTYNSRQQVSSEVDPSRSRSNKRWWYFGNNARLDFGAYGDAEPMAGTMSGQASNAIMAEGVTTVSNDNGQLLFFSDGLTVWDRNGNIMPVLPGDRNYATNCDAPAGSTFPFGPGGQSICGSHTATQAVAAFPINKARDKFMIISNTTNTHVLGHGTLYATYIYMNNSSYPNGVLGFRNWQVWMEGSVEQKNYASEAMNAKPSLDGKGAVVYTYRASSPNVVGAFKIWSDNDGFNIQRAKIAEVQMTSNPVPVCSSSAAGNTGFGSINFNADYTKMVVAMGGVGCNDSRGAGTVSVFDISGSDTNMRLLASWRLGAPDSRDAAQGYSADFSPSGRYVYASKIYPGELYRYDVSSENYTTIKASERFIGWTGCDYYWWNGGYSSPCSTDPDYRPKQVSGGAWPYADWLGRPGNGGGQVLRGPNGRMYVASRGAKHISQVQYPDAPNQSTAAATATAVGWSCGTVLLPNNAVSFYGLPQMVTIYSPRLLHY